jgi:transposase
MPRNFQRKRDHPPPNMVDMKRATAAVILDNVSIRKAAEEFYVKKSILYNYVKR